MDRQAANPIDQALCAICLAMSILFGIPTVIILTILFLAFIISNLQLLYVHAIGSTTHHLITGQLLNYNQPVVPGKCQHGDFYSQIVEPVSTLPLCCYGQPGWNIQSGCLEDGKANIMILCFIFLLCVVIQRIIYHLRSCLTYAREIHNEDIMLDSNV